MKDFNPLVSIIIPVYNGGNFVEQAIKSALAQTYKNIEIIVVNDGSTDNTEEIVKKYNVKYYKKINGGVSTALNLGITKARGDYISWLSHDDLYYKDKILKQINLLKGLEVDIRNRTIIYSNYSSIDEKGTLLGKSEFEKIYSHEKLNYPLFPILNGLIHGCALLIPIDCFKEIGYFDPKLRATQDYTLWFKMFPKYEIRFLADLTVNSRTHLDQDSKKLSSTEECDTLWINMINKLSKDQMRFMSGGVLAFYKNTLKIVTNANYTGAVKYLQSKIEEYKNRNMDDILVTVIIPFYNRISYTIEAIKSVLAQSHKNLEIILVNDGSEEDISKLRKFISQDPRIKLLSSEHLGSAHARNIALNKAKGEYIAFLDSDDLLTKFKIERQLKNMYENEAMITHTSYIRFESKKGEEEIDVGTISYTFPEIITGCGIATPTVMMHRDVLINKDIRFPENMTISEDICFWILLAKSNPIIGINEYLTIVRKHKHMTAQDPKAQIIGLRNRLDFVAASMINEQTLPRIILLNEIIHNETQKLYNLFTPQSAPVNSNYTQRISISQIFKKLTIMLSKFLPYYRKLNYIDRQINISRDKIDLMLNVIDSTIRHKDFKIQELEKELKLIKQLSRNINVKNFSRPGYTYFNLNGKRISFDGKHKSITLKFKVSLRDYFIGLKDYIIKTDVVLDIGCGIHPQVLFEPLVYICIEPFSEYREILKPYFPYHKSHFVFLREDAIKSLQVLDDNSVDTIFMLDVIEHLEKEEGLILLKEADRVARTQIIVYTPLGFYPQHYDESIVYDGWGLKGAKFQEHKSGWLPKDFGNEWDFFICVDGHEAYYPEEKARGKRYSALTAIKTKQFDGFKPKNNTPQFVTDNFYEYKL